MLIDFHIYIFSVKLVGSNSCYYRLKRKKSILKHITIRKGSMFGRVFMKTLNKYRL